MGAQKIRVAVIYGGRSGEHEVSLQSAASVVKNLDPNRFEIVPIGIDKQGHWLLNDVKNLGLENAIKSLPLQTSTSQRFTSLNHIKFQDSRALNPAKTNSIDVFFPVLHGSFGEDGTLQGMLEMMDVAYVGAGVLSSAIGMDKDVSKRLVAQAGLSIPPFMAVRLGEWQQNPSYYQQQIETRFGYPVFVKPANTGSSVGVHKVMRAEDLAIKVADAFLYDVKILIEQAVEAREIELSVLENPDYGSPPLVSVPGEVVPQHEFYSYAAKYLDADGAKLYIPAKIDKTTCSQAQVFAQQIFQILDCEGMARVDLFLDKHTGKFIFNEINTLPGFTQISMYPKLWEASGVSYQQLLSYLIDLAITRHQRKSNLKRDWEI